MGDYSPFSSDCKTEKIALQRLLETCDQLNIPLTFDVVGHLLLESCTGEHAGPYQSGWWDEDPGTNFADAPLFYAPEMVAQIRNQSADHEICTHTFSHIHADEGDDLLRHELEQVQNIHAEAGLSPPVSIVLPKHRTPSYSVLREYDIQVIRRPILDYTPDFNTRLQKWWWLVSREHPPCKITTKEGIIETTCTPHPSLTTNLLPQGQQKSLPWFLNKVPLQLRQRKHRQYLRNSIDRAAEGGYTHLWTHLHNMSNDTQWSQIEDALSYIATQRDAGRIEIQRMRDLPKLTV